MNGIMVHQVIIFLLCIGLILFHLIGFYFNWGFVGILWVILLLLFKSVVLFGAGVLFRFTGVTSCSRSGITRLWLGFWLGWLWLRLAIIFLLFWGCLRLCLRTRWSYIRFRFVARFTCLFFWYWLRLWRWFLALITFVTTHVLFFFFSLSGGIIIIYLSFFYLFCIFLSLLFILFSSFEFFTFFKFLLIFIFVWVHLDI